MYFDNTQFRYEFRDYQQRVLDSLKEKLSDNRINVVAAPGSGKTVLGLELVRRLDKPCLILAPSISIREQWIERFLEMFVYEEDKEAWGKRISIDLNEPELITCITYQALYVTYSEGDFDSCINKLKKHNCGCMVLDESHHLKREWWKAIENAVRGLGEPTLISLTATPPYDSDNGEWARYNELCGEIDCEVLTPEMVKKNTLCPYQDHVYITVPTQDELVDIQEQSRITETNWESVLKGKTLYRLMKDYRALARPQDKLEIFIENPYALNAFIAYIRNYGIESAMFYEDNVQTANEVIASWDEKMVSVAKESAKLIVNKQLFKILLECILYKDASSFDKGLLEQFTDELKQRKLLIKNKLSIEDAMEEKSRMIRESRSKMEAIKDIVCHEAKSCKDSLQMVILTDNIGREELSQIGTGNYSGRMSCVSIFEMLRSMEHLNNLDAYMQSYEAYIEELAGTSLGVLCGSFAIMPECALDVIDKNGKELANSSYYQIEITDKDRRNIVAQVTKALAQGRINVLIGTVSLLGEGWDAPGVNTVIIGSSISSFVMTNQMRGRGLRVDPDNENKVANIWHLVTLDTKGDGEYSISSEYANLIKRFDTILGMDNWGNQISSGIERVGLRSNVSEADIFTTSWVEEHRKRTFDYSDNRNLIRRQWQQLIDFDSGFDKVRDVIAIRKKSILNWQSRDDRYNQLELNKIANGLHKNMKRLEMLSKDSWVRVESDRRDGKIRVYLENASSKESKLYLRYFEQTTGEIIAPRYIMSKGIGPWRNYFAVPDYCKNKDMAIAFRSDLDFYKADIIYTRSKEGLQFLFELRMGKLRADRSTVERVRQIVIDK